MDVQLSTYRYSGPAPAGEGQTCLVALGLGARGEHGLQLLQRIVRESVRARTALFVGFDFWPFLKGVTRGDCALHLPVQAVQEIAEEYARRRRQHRKVRLAWRKSRGARRSLGWIPFKGRTIRYRGGQIYFEGRGLALWDSHCLGNI